MEDLNKSVEDIKSYLKKLLNVIERDAKFSFGNRRFMDKTKIDDIICCIDTSFPKKYKEMLKYLPQKDVKKLASDIAYSKLKNLVQNKFFLNNQYYYLKNIDIIKECIITINSNINRDLDYVYKLI